MSQGAAIKENQVLKDQCSSGLLAGRGIACEELHDGKGTREDSMKMEFRLEKLLLPRALHMQAADTVNVNVAKFNVQSVVK